MPNKPYLKQKTLWRLALALVAIMLLVRLVMIVEKNKPTINQSPVSSTTTSQMSSTTPVVPVAKQKSAPKIIHGTPLSLITEPQDGIAPVLAMIDGAKKSVDLVIYELSDKNIEQALTAAQKRGLAVRVLLNPGYYGKPEYYNQTAYDYFVAQNIPAHWTPAYFALTHEKTLIVDNQAALIMTFNLTPKYYPTDRDFGVLDEDAGDVAEIENNFVADWNNHETQNIASLPNNQNQDDLIWSPNAQTKIINLINSAKISLQVYNEEMADQAIEQALENAATKKVRVQVIMTAAKNWQKDFQALTADQVQIKTYAADAALYIHAKMIIVDDKQAFVGSQNFSDNSLNANRELGIITTDQKIISSLTKTFTTDFAGATAFAQ